MIDIIKMSKQKMLISNFQLNNLVIIIMIKNRWAVEHYCHQFCHDVICRHIIRTLYFKTSHTVTLSHKFATVEFALCTQALAKGSRATLSNLSLATLFLTGDKDYLGLNENCKHKSTQIQKNWAQQRSKSLSIWTARS